ncbi:MAG: peptidoglycan DD-metalloendopeptidase family protein [Oscillospiraceae bacterium]|nr:peptidoglycan DD-metalloendopeptidase family protein [Oscillospiraceae bacterium]
MPKAVKAAVGAPRRLTQGARLLAQEKKSNRFPESEFAAVQLLLLVWGCLPMVGSALQERLLRRRKRSARARTRARSRWDELRLNPAIFLSGALVIAAVAVVLSLYTVGTAVSYDGVPVCVVADRKTVESTVDEVEELTRTALHDDGYAVDRNKLQVQRKLAARRSVESRETLRQLLIDRLEQVSYGYMLYVDGESVAATTFPGALEELLEQMKIGYITPSTVECSFTEQVEVREEYVPRSELMNLGYIAEKINDVKAGEVRYTVVKGDTYYGVAEKFGLSLSQLMEMNPGYDPDLLRTGDVLTVSRAVPYLTVVDVERQSYVQDLPYQVTYQDDATMYQGDYKVLSSGVYGKADVTANVTYVNGAETGRQIVASVTLTQPIAELQARGTKERPSWFPTGTFRWPCTGTITSYFGGRNTGISGASTYHEALDIANGTGTPIYAADGGTVIIAGWWGGTGYTVKIDHGNGFVTIYGHNSSLLVNVGDHVYQGQQIARMGSTGVASGPHCHFGIQLNGTYVNPLNYLS